MMLRIKAIAYIFLIDHIARDPRTGKHYFTWRRL